MTSVPWPIFASVAGALVGVIVWLALRIINDASQMKDALIGLDKAMAILSVQMVNLDRRSDKQDSLLSEAVKRQVSTSNYPPPMAPTSPGLYRRRWPYRTDTE